jgi:hypothetical protein
MIPMQMSARRPVVFYFFLYVPEFGATACFEPAVNLDNGLAFIGT